MEECGVSLCGSTVQPRELLSQTPPLIDDTCSIQHSHQDPTHIEGMLSDRSIGKLLFAANTAAILYYILWIGVMPFVDPSHFTQRLFLPREYGLLLAALCLMGGLGLSVTLASFHMINKTGYFEEVDGSTQTGAAAIPKDTRATKLK